MKLIKRQSVSSWCSLFALLLTLAGLILYVINVNSAGFFNGAEAPATVTCAILGIVCLAIVIALGQFDLGGVTGGAINIVSGALKILSAVLPIIALMAFISTRVEGFGYMFFSNEEVMLNNRTPENLASAYVAIAGFAAFALTWLVSVIAAFFTAKTRKTTET